MSNKNIFFAIIIIAFLIRIWGLGSQELLGDEGVYAFRSVGYLDYIGTSFQTQPIDWYKGMALPAWTKLSFHDHPPLSFLINNLFFTLLGDSVFVARLASALFGIGSIILFYFIVKELSLSLVGDEAEKFSLLSSFIFSLNSGAILISRVVLIESILLFFIIFNIYLFLKLLKDIKYWWLFGISLGLVALTKYIGVFLIPLYFIYLFILKRNLLKRKELYYSLFLALLVFSPVIIYNYYLYQFTGHFDLQIAYLLSQDTPEWTGLLGKAQSPFSQIIPNLISLYSLFILSTALAGLFIISYKINKQLKENKEYGGYLFIYLYIICLTLLLVKIGSANRFIALYSPAISILIAIIIGYLWIVKNKLSLFSKFIVIAFVLWMGYFSINKIVNQQINYGIIGLDNYLNEEFKDVESAVIPESDNNHLTDIIYKYSKKRTDNPRKFFMIVYNDNISLPIIDWVFYRRFFYHGIPTMYVENFNSVIQSEGVDYFKGFNVYFIQSTENTLLNEFKKDKVASLELENNLLNQGLSPEKIIYGHNNLPMFKIYKFSF